MATGFLERGERAVERLYHRLDQSRRLRRASLKPADRASEHRHSGIAAGDDFVRFAQVLDDLLRLHHDAAALGQRGLFPRLGAELAELLDRVAQPVALALGALHLGTVRLSG